MTGIATRGSSKFKLRAPARLRPVPPRLRLPVGILWTLALLLALASQAGGLWRGFVQASVIDQRFAAVGLVTSIDEAGAVRVHPATRAVLRAGVPATGVITAVDGRAVAAGTLEEAIAARLAGPPGTATLAIRAVEGRSGSFPLARSEAVRAESWRDGIGAMPAFLATASFGLVAAIVLIVAAVLLRRRRSRDPVALLLSLGFLLLAASLERPIVFYEWLGLGWLSSVVPSLWLGTLIAVLPAFPDGRFVPRWGGWLALLAPPLTLFVIFDEQLGEVTTIVGFVAAIAAAATPLIRYRRTPPGLERQQLKWAAFGFIGSILLLVATYCFFLLSEAGLVPIGASEGASLALLCAINLSFALLPLGVLVALMRFRLWDADAAIGRSIGYASVTLVLGGLWAATAKLAEEAFKARMGDASEPMIAAISTVVAALVFQPLRARVSRWVDRRFRAGLAHLRKLPERFRLWQHSDLPDDIAERVIDAAMPALRASRAAMLLHGPQGWRLLRAVEIDQGEIETWRASHLAEAGTPLAALDRRDSLFPVRLLLEDGQEPIGALLLGPRTDGSVYSSEEREVLAGLELPLAAALRRGQQRQLRDARLGATLAAFDRRLAALEREAIAPAVAE